MIKSWIDIQNEPIKAMKKLPLHLVASKRIVNDYGLTLLSITGNQQGGKSSYGMLILNEIFGGDVEQVLKHIVMSAGEFVDILEKAITGGYRERCIMWDDLSVEGSAATWLTNPLLVKHLAALGDTLGIATKSLILTSPSGDMIKAFRNYQKYKIIIGNGQGKYGRVARGYWFGRSPLDQPYCQHVFEDKYDTRIPFYEIYAQKRKEISLKAVLAMKETQAEKAEKEKKPTIGEKAQELYRDWKAGVFGDDITFKTLCKTHKLNYGYAKSIGSC